VRQGVNRKVRNSGVSQFPTLPFAIPYGFRPKKSAHDALDDVSKYLGYGYTQVIDADISKYFDTIPHDNLLSTVAERISDGAILHIIKLWLKAPVIETDEDGTKRNAGSNSKGTPQGGIISPLLANIYLHLFDRIWEKRGYERKLGAHIVRYADDVVILCRSGTDKPMEKFRKILGKLELTLNETKTLVVDAHTDSFGFLGFTIQMMKSKRTGNWFPHLQPSKKSLQSIKDRVTELTKRERTHAPLSFVVDDVNSTVRGWVGYFHYRNCSQALSKLKEHVETRMKIHLGNRHKTRGLISSLFRTKTKDLYAIYGLYKTPTTAGWTQAHALG
jgi:group II intron reverse transcriptase/maturase